jgi:predicted regulator of Ras-like GTPase activity (Roadblock/LC7/MglB family)
MSFGTVLREIVDSCGGGIGAVLMGSDGIPIEQVVSEGVPEGPLTDDICTAGVEFNRILEEIRKASDALAGGAVAETVVVLSRFSLVFQSVDEDTYLSVIVAPHGNLGKARYLMRRSLLAIRQEL